MKTLHHCVHRGRHKIRINFWVYSGLGLFRREITLLLLVSLGHPTRIRNVVQYLGVVKTENWCSREVKEQEGALKMQVRAALVLKSW